MWVKLSEEALGQFECQGTAGYALSYSSERKQDLLEEMKVRSSSAPSFPGLSNFVLLQYEKHFSYCKLQKLL